MTVIIHPDFLGFYGRNGRDYNVILTFKNDEFHFSTPNTLIKWNKNNPMPQEVISAYKKGEMKRVLKFIDNYK